MKALLLIALLALAEPALSQGYGNREDVKAFARELVQRHGFVDGELKTLFSRIRRNEGVLEAIKPKPPGERDWQKYRAQFVNERRVTAGLAFWSTHRSTLERSERKYGVPAAFVVAIIGIETFYGQNMGRWRVADVLTTLAFDYPPRADFFRSELEHYLLLARDESLDVFSVQGSYAGAIGIPQFMPGSSRRYAVDFDGDGAIDLRHSPRDAIGSVGNFLRQHGWRAGAAVHSRARVSGEEWRKYADGSVDAKHAISDLLLAGVNPDQELSPGLKAALIDLGSEQRLGLHNFYVLTRYNRSALYASAVIDLAEALTSQRRGR